MSDCLSAEEYINILISKFIEGKIDIGNDFKILHSFYNLVEENKPFTKKQSQYAIFLLNKYRSQLDAEGIRLPINTTEFKWKLPFREINQDKKIWIEFTENNGLEVAIIMPWNEKIKFEKAVPSILDFSISRWDSNAQIRYLDFYGVNLVEIYEYVSTNGFTIDQSYFMYLSLIEEIWNDSEKVSPHCVILDNNVYLKNASESTLDFWNENKKNILVEDLLLAKEMGYCLWSTSAELTTIEKIAKSQCRNFWFRDINHFFELYKNTEGKCAVIIDKNQESIAWLKKFVENAKSFGLNINEFRVCFRMPKSDDTDFNDWVKENNLGGSVDSGRLYIFQSKPSKWIFSNKVKIQLIATNSLYPIPSTLTQRWLENHPLVFHLEEIKASILKEKEIVEL